MKRIILLTALFLAAVTTVWAEEIDDRVNIGDVKIEHQGDFVKVEYTVAVAPRAVKRGYTLLLAPVVIGGEYRQSLPAVVIRGRGTGIAAKRGEWVSGLVAERENITSLSNGQIRTLTAIVPFQEWMYGARLFVEAAEGGCCSYRELAGTWLDGGFLSKPEPEPVVAVAAPEPPVWEPVTLADSLSTAFTFVLPATEYDELEPFKIYDDERENALVVYYHVGKYDIDPGYFDNAYTLSSLTNVIRMIMDGSDSSVERVIVAGFASPEGGFELNDRLAFDRAVSVKKYIMDKTGLADNSIQLYNGSVDWRGLRAMVARSTLPEKQQILSIIDNTPIVDSREQAGRLGALQRLDGGRPYRYLLHEYFPYLRSGAFIRVYYENESRDK